MGSKDRPDTIDPELQLMIDRYVKDAIHSTGTRGPRPTAPRERVARGSEAPAIHVEIVDPLWTDAEEEITSVFARPPSAT